MIGDSRELLDERRPLLGPVKREEFLKLVEHENGSVHFAEIDIPETAEIFPHRAVLRHIGGQKTAFLELAAHLHFWRFVSAVEAEEHGFELLFFQFGADARLQQRGFAAARLAEQHHEVVQHDEAVEFLFLRVTTKKEVAVVVSERAWAWITVHSHRLKVRVFVQFSFELFSRWEYVFQVLRESLGQDVFCHAEGFVDVAQSIFDGHAFT